MAYVCLTLAYERSMTGCPGMADRVEQAVSENIRIGDLGGINCFV